MCDKLLDVPQPLELWCVYDSEQKGVELNVPMDWVVNNCRFGSQPIGRSRCLFSCAISTGLLNAVQFNFSVGVFSFCWGRFVLPSLMRKNLRDEKHVKKVGEWSMS